MSIPVSMNSTILLQVKFFKLYRHLVVRELQYWFPKCMTCFWQFPLKHRDQLRPSKLTWQFMQHRGNTLMLCWAFILHFLIGFTIANIQRVQTQKWQFYYTSSFESQGTFFLLWNTKRDVQAARFHMWKWSESSRIKCLWFPNTELSLSFKKTWNITLKLYELLLEWF